MTQKQLEEKVNVLWSQDYMNQRKVMKLEGEVKGLKKSVESLLDEAVGLESVDLYFRKSINQLEKTNAKLLQRIVWIEKALKNKADKKVLKQIKKVKEDLKKSTGKKSVVRWLKYFKKRK